MELVTAVGIISLILIALGIFWLGKANTKDMGKIATGAGVVFLIVAFAGAGGNLATLSGVQPASDSGGPDDPAPPGAAEKPYTVLTVGTHIDGSNDYATATGSFMVFEKGVNPATSNANAYDEIFLVSGAGSTTAAKLKSATDYVMVYNGSDTYYDQWYNSLAFPLTSQLPYIQTDESAISTANINVRDILTIATISDPLNEAAVTGIINGQTTAANTTSGSSNELMIGTGVTAADDDTIYYNKTNGDGQFYIDITIAFDGADKKVKNPVLDIVNDLSNPFDGNEFSSVTMIRQSGTDYGIPRTVTDYVNKANPIPLGTEVEGGDSGVYR
ncbi:hypothetical protein KAR91_74405, partial [Candidatus Pacearchaeota archaeon]|nr:hypothetical protein [Candidatus Pacearchaeota archaeon]